MEGPQKSPKSPIRQMPKRAAKRRPGVESQERHQNALSVSTTLNAGVTKRTGRSGTKSHKKSGRSRSKQEKKKKARGELNRKVDAMDQKAAWQEQSELLGLSPDSIQATLESLESTPSPRSPHGKRSRKGKGKKTHKGFVDDLLDDGLDSDDSLQLSERHIPRMEHRGHPVEKPDNVPQSLWLAYCHLNDYIYRQSLPEDVIKQLPLIEEYFKFQHGGPAPSLPPGFEWSAHGELLAV
ncbi:hypothetical protein F4778DRAFT_716844 [Xylariomycetidae sp. FL2044]|nr:hypothetical protein F4778DRAFT_716844 [Xylariomycetidae sp. FL2044]